MNSKRRSILVGAAIASGALLAALAPALPAVGDHSPVGGESPAPPVLEISIGDTAALGAKGAVVFVPVEVRCSEHADASVSVRLTQRSGGRIAQGIGFTSDIVCDGEFHTVTVAVTATVAPFKKGVAFAQADAFASFPEPNFLTTEAYDEAEIQIVKSP